MSCPRCAILAKARAGGPIPKDVPEHAVGCPRSTPRAPVAPTDAAKELRRLGLQPPAEVADAPPTSGCMVCDQREAVEDIPVGLALVLCCVEHADQILHQYVTSTLRSVIPERHQPARDVPDALRDWDGRDGRGAFLYGPVGTGKSWGASALMKRAWMRRYRTTGEGPTMLWINAATVFADLRSQMGAKHKGPDPLAAARAVWLLTIDDLGAERPTAWTAEHLYVLLNERYERMRPTLVTSNYDLGQLVGRMTPTDDEGSTRGEQLVSRLAGMTLQVPFSGDDRRVPT